jgi:hypothetical protein
MASKELQDLSIKMATPPQEKAIQTSAGMETATQTVDRVKSALANPVNASNVPMSLMSQPTPAVTLPQTPVVPTDKTVLSEGGQIMDGFAKQKEAEAVQAGQKYSASEQKLREQFGILGTESQARTQLEDKAGVNAYSQDLTKFQESLRRQMADLDQFDLDNVNTIEVMRVDASKRDITKRTFSAMSAEANIQMAVQRAGKVASTRATIAAIDVTQGNLKGATEQVDKALKAVYDPIRLGIQMESQFLQNNMQLFTSAQSAAANARLKVMEQEVAEIDRIQRSVDDAISSGATTPNEMYMLASPDTTNDERLALSQLIKARGAKDMRDLQMRSAQMDLAVKAEQLAKLRQPVVATRDTSVIDVNGTKQLVDTQTGEVIASFGADVSTNEVQQARDANFINTIDALKTHPGMSKAVGTTPLARWTPFKADVMTGQVSDFVGSIENVVKNLTLNTYAEAKEKGMTFGAMSEGEWEILGDSATKINSWRRERNDGSIYYDTSEKNMKKELDTLSNFGKMDVIRKGGNPADIGVIDLGNGTYATRNSDGSIYEFSVTPQ